MCFVDDVLQIKELNRLAEEIITLFESRLSELRIVDGRKHEEFRSGHITYLKKLLDLLD